MSLALLEYKQGPKGTKLSVNSKAQHQPVTCQIRQRKQKILLSRFGVTSHPDLETCPVLKDYICCMLAGSQMEILASSTAYAATRKAHFSLQGTPTASNVSLPVNKSPLANQVTPTQRMKSTLLDYTLTDRKNPPPMSGAPDKPSMKPVKRNWIKRIFVNVFSSTGSATSSHPYTPIEKPWLLAPSRANRIRATLSYFMIYILFLVGVGLAVIQGYVTIKSATSRMIIAPNNGPFGSVGAFMRSGSAIAYPKTLGTGFEEGIAAGKYEGQSQSNQCLKLTFDETFSDGDENIFGTYDNSTGQVSGGRWMREVTIGNSNGEFEMTTLDPSNSFVLNNQLYIMPTLTTDSGVPEAQLLNGAVYNITGCTYNQTNPLPPNASQADQAQWESNYLWACSAVSNSTTGSMIPPVQSARLTTRGPSSLSQGIGKLRYGMIEVRAKMPRGDWFWPAIWMLPVPVDDSTPDGTGMLLLLHVIFTRSFFSGWYGAWPRSGEIDIVESRGNGIEYTARGSNYVQGTLNWGPTPDLNSAAKSYSWWSDKRQGFDEGFHIYRLEWDERFLRISIDTRLHTLLDISFNEAFFTRGDYPDTFVNQTTGALQGLVNPWINASDSNSVNAAPFDRDFYLILNVAVGSRNGWFPEGQGNKPWLDGSATAMQDFWNARLNGTNDTPGWLTTWPGSGVPGAPADIRDRAMVVDYVKIWEKTC